MTDQLDRLLELQRIKTVGIEENKDTYFIYKEMEQLKSQLQQAIKDAEKLQDLKLKLYAKYEIRDLDELLVLLPPSGTTTSDYSMMREVYDKTKEKLQKEKEELEKKLERELKDNNGLRASIPYHGRLLVENQNLKQTIEKIKEQLEITRKWYIENRPDCWSKECLGCEWDYLDNELNKLKQLLESKES